MSITRNIYIILVHKDDDGDHFLWSMLKSLAQRNFRITMLVYLLKGAKTCKNDSQTNLKGE